MLSACLIVKNEEAMLKECLKSLKGIDEIIIVDTGSTDKTVEIASKYGKVYHHKWKDDFSDARNYALSKSNGDWNLIIDADEILLTPVSEIELDDNYDALEVKVSWSDTSFHRGPRIFKKGLRYQGKVHEYVVCNPKKTNIEIRYRKSPQHEVDPDRNLRILLKDKSVRNKYYLAQEYFDRGEWEKALREYKAYIKVGTWRYEIADANLRASKCLFNLQRGDEARNYCLQAILGNPEFKEALLHMADMSWDNEAKTWRRYAETATNENCLFIRT